MRYAEAQYGEEPRAVGIFTTGASVTVVVVDSADTLYAVASNVATELTNMPGVFVWSASNLTAPPTGFTELIVRMTDTVSGRQHVSKIVVGGFPSDSAIRRFNGAVHIDTTGAGTAGTAFPIGTPEMPSSNVTDARTIAVAQGITKYVLNGAATIIVDHLNWTFEGIGDAGASVYTFTNAADITGSSFFQATVLGDLSGGGRISAQESLIGEVGGTVIGLQGILNTVGLFGTIQPAPGGTIEGTEVASRDVIAGTTLDFNGGAATIILANVQGVFSVINNTNALGVLGAALAGALLTIAASNTSGIYILLGYGEVSDSKAGAISYTENVLHGTTLHNVLSAVASRAIIDVTTNPWREIRYVFDEEAASDSVVWEIFELYDQDGVAIAGDDTAGNNPLFDPTRLLAERRRV